MIDLEVPPLDEAATLEEQLVLVALNVNTSHVTMLVEVRRGGMLAIHAE